jgi:hypothetical protein
VNPGLPVLWRLLWRGRLRRAARGLGTPRGALLSLLGLLVMAAAFGPSLWLAWTAERPDHETVTGVAASLILLTLCSIVLMPAATPGGAYFTPAEVNLLFPGPFSRRALLAYKLTAAAPRVALAALLVTLAELAFVPWWLAATVGIFLTMLLFQLSGMIVALGLQTLAGRAHTALRRLGLAAAGLSLLAGVAGLVAHLRPGGLLGLPAPAAAATTLLAGPVTVFARAIAARHAGELALWGGLALATDAALLALVFWLDARWEEGAVLASQRAVERRRARRPGGPLPLTAVTGPARWRLPGVPWLGGAGPLAWRQLTGVLRQPWNFAGIVLFALVMLAPGLTAGPSPAGLALAVLALGPLFSMWLQCDFRGDVDHLAALKALPLAPAAVAAGQLAGPALLTALVQLAVLAAALVLVEPWTPLLAAAVVPPASLLLFGVQNLLFLLLPARLAPATAGDFQHVARLAVLGLLQFAALGAAGALAVLVGVGAAGLAGGSWAVGAAAGWVTLLLEAAGIVPAVAWAYARLDVSRDTPPVGA